MLEDMARLQQVLHKKRERRGAINFELPEQKVLLDDQKHPVAIVKRERSVAEMLIEEFMLAANETVAGFMARHKRPFIYRVHDLPDPEKIQNLAKLMALFGVTLKVEEKMRPKDLQRALDKVAGNRKRSWFPRWPCGACARRCTRRKTSAISAWQPISIPISLLPSAAIRI